MSGQARALTPGEVQKLLDRITPGEWITQDDYGAVYVIMGNYPYTRIADCPDEEGISFDVRRSNAALIAAAPSLIADLLAQNAALAAELARAQAGAQAVDEAWKGCVSLWRELGDRMLLVAASDLQDRMAAIALAQASAEGAGAGEVAG